MSQQTFTQKVITKTLSERPWVYRKGNKYRVVPRRLGHGKYELTCVWENGVPRVTDCRDFRTGEGCKGFTYSKACYHSFSLLRKLMLYKLQAESREMRTKILAFPAGNEAHRSGVAGG